MRVPLWFQIRQFLWVLPRGTMVSNLVLLDQLRLSSQFDPNWALQTFGLMPNISYTLKIICSLRRVSKLDSPYQLLVSSIIIRSAIICTWKIIIWILRRSVIHDKVHQLWLSSEINPYMVLHIFGLVPHRIYA